MNVYLLQHGDEVEGVIDVKVVGIFPSRAEAEEARARAIALPGFRDRPNGFSIDPYELGAGYWTTGFVSRRSGGGIPDRSDDVTRDDASPERS